MANDGSAHGLPPQPTASGTDSNRDTSGQSIASQVASAAKDVAGDAKETISTIAGDVGDTIASAATEQKDVAADALDDVAEALKRSAEGLEGQQDWIAHVVEAGATELGSLAGTLRSNDLQGVLGTLQDLARRQPAIFLGAAMAAGFAAVRVGKVAAAGGAGAARPDTAGIDNGRR